MLHAARELFAVQGFVATGREEIAERAGVTRGALYHHFGSKGQLLEQIMDDTMDRLIVTTAESVARVEEEPAAQLRAAVAAHVRFHIEYQRESFVGANL